MILIPAIQEAQVGLQFDKRSYLKKKTKTTKKSKNGLG
jgi:hypothetical protein